jgi:DNA-binding response OmpR family regulator
MGAEIPPNTVLVVQEDSISRSALAWLLKELGFQSIVAGDLAAAREVLGTTTPQVLILDLMLPDGNGTELLAEIRRAHWPITVAVVTGVTDQLKLHELMAWKPDAIFGKPLDVHDFDDWLVKQLSNFALASLRESQEKHEG